MASHRAAVARQSLCQGNGGVVTATTMTCRVIATFRDKRGDDAAMSVYSAVQTATVCQVSLRTVQRKMPQLEAAGAWKDAAGQWHIPLVAMRSAGLSPGRPSPPDSDYDMSLRQRDTDSDTVSQLRAELAEWRRRAEVAEAQAAERERIIKAQQMALQMLDAAPQPAAALESLAAPHPPVWQQPASLLARLLRF